MGYLICLFAGKGSSLNLKNWYDKRVNLLPETSGLVKDLETCEEVTFFDTRLVQTCILLPLFYCFLPFLKIMVNIARYY